MLIDLEGAAVLFDLDGTLVDTADDLAASMNQALVAAGHDPAPARDVRGMVGYGARKMLARGYKLSAGRDASESELDAGLKIFLSHYTDNIAVHSRPFDGVVDLIGDLRRRGAAIAICTNKREALSRRLVEALGITPLFDLIVGADTAAAPKPDPAPVIACINGVMARRAVFIGDSDTDIAAASAAGVPCLIAEFGYGPLTKLESAAATFKDYAAAGPLIENALRD